MDEILKAFDELREEILDYENDEPAWDEKRIAVDTRLGALRALVVARTSTKTQGALLRVKCAYCDDGGRVSFWGGWRRCQNRWCEAGWVKMNGA